MTSRPETRRAQGQSEIGTTAQGFSLTVLGAATPYPRPDQPCSGYLLRTPHAARQGLG